MTEQVHELLTKAVHDSGRSMNAEINKRLLNSFEQTDKLSKNSLKELMREAIREELANK